MYDNVVDEAGRSWAINDPELVASLSTSLRGDALKSFVVMNLGWIAVRTKINAFHVRCRPSLVSDSAMATLLFKVHDRPEFSIMLDIFRGDWMHFLLRDRCMFVRFFASIVAGERRPGFWRGPRLLNCQKAPACSPFGAKAGMARALGESMDQVEDMKRIFDVLFNGRWALHSLDSQRGHSVIDDIGTRYTPFNPKWLAAAKGQSLCAYGDESYGLWIANLQRTACDNAEAIFDDVDAVVAFPGIGDTRLRYSRMTLPIRRPDGRLVVLSSAVSNSSIDLRLAERQEAG